jgi:hypothetical protein
MKYLTLLVAAALIGTASVAQTNQVKPEQSQSMPAKMSAANPQAAKGEKHPNITAAQKALENAKDHLQKAPHDFGGHRTKAVEAINLAQDELKQALKWDEEHEHDAAPKK